MRFGFMKNTLVFCLLFLCGAVSVFAGGVSLSGRVQNAGGDPIENAVVLLKVENALLAYARTLTDADGNFSLGSPEAPAGFLVKNREITKAWSFVLNRSGWVKIDVVDMKGELKTSVPMQGLAGVNMLQSPSSLLNKLPQGIYIFSAQYEGKRTVLGKRFHSGATSSEGARLVSTSARKKSVLALQAIDGEYLLIARKAGYLPDTVDFTSFVEDVGTITLQRDPLEDRIDSVMALMTLNDKIYQMTQPQQSSSNVYGGSLPNYSFYGSVLDGGDGYSSTFMSTMLSTLNSWSKPLKIPVTYGKDAVHGNAGVEGYTIFPHNIGLGAARDSALVRRIGEATAKELWAAGIDLNFSPAVSVPRNERWGRTYEGFGETPELAAEMGAAMVRGLQGERYDAPWRVTATAKHYLGDGGTANGKDRGNTAITDEELRAVHLPPYEAVVEQGVLSVMASFNQINGVHQHVDSIRMTGWLKTELGFDGYIISDWAGIANSNKPGSAGDYINGDGTLTKDAVKKAVNAGIDLAMEPGSHTSFISYLQSLASSGEVSQERINDAVRRILRAKFRAGRMDNFSGPAEYRSNVTYKGHPDHRALAREAVRKSLVLLKNEESVLPLSKSGQIAVIGTHANNTGRQCGGWTIAWQGTTISVLGLGATSILSGITTQLDSTVVPAASADVIINVVGEEPYAEWEGDISSPNFTVDTTQLATYRAQGKKVVTVFISGRPRVVNALIDNSDAFIAAWLPGSEGAGVADVLFGDYAPTGKLPHTWPANADQVPINTGDGQEGLYPYGYGLTYED